jgi:ketosteroid isomerase-like protein
MKILVILRMMAGFLPLLMLVAPVAGSGQSSPVDSSTQTQIAAILNEQKEAWDRGDVEAFMQAYWSSPEVTFAGSSGVTRGWQPVMERYRKNYPNREAMGQLDFSQIEIHTLGKDAALVIGRWHLKRNADELGGVFTLVFQKFPEGWRIVHDHTSLDAKPS